MNTFDNAKASRGLHLLFLSEIVILVGAFLSALILGLIVSVAGYVLSIYSLYLLSSVSSPYQHAFYCSIAGLVVSLLSFLLGGLAGILGNVLSLLIVYFVCTATSELLVAAGHADLAERGISVWKMYLVCTIVSIACGLLAMIPVLGMLALPISLVLLIAMVAAYVLFLSFLNKASGRLQAS